MAKSPHPKGTGKKNPPPAPVPVTFPEILKNMQDIGWEKFSECCGGFFFLLHLPPEFDELEPRDRLIFLRCEVSAALQFELADTHIPGLYCAERKSLREGIEQVWVDCRTDIYSMTLIGRQAAVKKYSAEAASSERIDVIPFNNDSLTDFGKKIGKISEFSHEFTAETAYGASGRIGGTVSGFIADDEYRLRTGKFASRFCLRHLTGISPVSPISVVTVHREGLFNIIDFDRESLTDSLTVLHGIISAKIGDLLKNYVFRAVHAPKGKPYYEIRGLSLSYTLLDRAPDISLFYERLMRASKPLNCYVCQLKSLQLDRLFRLISMKNGAGVEVAANSDIIRYAAGNYRCRAENKTKITADDFLQHLNIPETGNLSFTRKMYRRPVIFIMRRLTQTDGDYIGLNPLYTSDGTLYGLDTSPVFDEERSRTAFMRRMTSREVLLSFPINQAEL
ncbi:hypothetical protein CHS0354_002039 [Potamilus streckersoni]|uniref:Uncharacterized protein n=1 Tax=Potamilus streckersoni TaxID=2493646 RepID=A0AAE0W7E0_9BIVA|nr:hypothetical protein CHS0354_002039 [Potamilus streckersoni]